MADPAPSLSARKAFQDWLFNSPDRKTGGESWTDAQVVDVATFAAGYAAAPREPLIACVRAADAMQTTLAELVACKDLKDTVDEYDPAFQWTDEQRAEYFRMKEDYARRKPLAWSAARTTVPAYDAARSKVTLGGDGPVTDAPQRHGTGALDPRLAPWHPAYVPAAAPASALVDETMPQTLRRWADEEENAQSMDMHNVRFLREAADALERLERERDTAISDREDHRNAWIEATRRMGVAEREREEARAENATLREFARLVTNMHNMTDAELAELNANARAVVARQGKTDG